VVGCTLGLVLGILAFVLWIILMIKAGRGERYKILWAGDFTEKWVGRHERMPLVVQATTLPRDKEVFTEGIGRPFLRRELILKKCQSLEQF